MKLIRNGLLGAAAGIALILPGGTANAAPQGAAVTTTVTTLDGTQGWGVDTPAFAHEFVAGPHSIGRGSLQFRPNVTVADQDKMFVKALLNVSPDKFNRVGFDYYFAPDSPVKDPAQFYLNVYVDDPTVSGATFYDCKYDYLATRPADGIWRTLTVRADRAADRVVPANGATCAPSIAQLPARDNVWFLALNAGDTTRVDDGMKGGFDNVVIRKNGTTTVYDFEPPGGGGGGPAEDCTAPAATRSPGTTGNDLLNGTDAADRIDLKGGNDSSDADDCVLGADGNDRITGGAGGDELRGGRGNDQISGEAGDDMIDGGDGNDDITPGAGKDTVDAGGGNDVVRAKDGERDSVDCGPGQDLVMADPIDDVTPSCEQRS